MKRRLSVVISTIGNPRIVFMDEPTTGMDPVNRRHVWSFIEKFKKGRVIVLVRFVDRLILVRPLIPWKKRMCWEIVLPSWFMVD
jgi:energy-coupling factor transporter ATP-binding protein EcfA2